ncbi:DUF3574 domain-containing protein [Sorangium sp. So ce131]|uniref:DUF3574 domain-containing protein n=1 Tax=Sorangium sp. So ce131 TaxID=3133282 RepID=UPI003F617199
MTSRPLLPALLAALFVAAGCYSAEEDPLPAPTAEPTCESGDPMVRTELFFGMDRLEGPPVTQEEWQEFVDTVVTPRFEDGLTQFDVDGQYRASTGELIHEDSRLIMLLHDGGQAASDAIDAIREQYKQRFDQESVLRIDEAVCVAF